MRARDSPICIFFLLKKGMQDKKAIGLPILSTNKRTGGKAIMIRTKRILALFLAVVLIFSALPFSVSADELPVELSTESTVESQPEESQAEEPEEQAPAENAITISDSSGDVPVLYAQDPFNTVKSEVEGGTNYMTSVGVTRESIVRELEAHEDDNYLSLIHI